MSESTTLIVRWYYGRLVETDPYFALHTGTHTAKGTPLVVFLWKLSVRHTPLRCLALTVVLALLASSGCENPKYRSSAAGSGFHEYRRYRRSARL